MTLAVSFILFIFFMFEPHTNI